MFLTLFFFLIMEEEPSGGESTQLRKDRVNQEKVFLLLLINLKQFPFD